MNIKSMLSSWKTTVIGLLTFVCEGTTLTVLPDKYMQIGHSICIILLACGVIAAKDGNVSNAIHQTEAHKVPQDLPATPTIIKVE